MRIERFNSSCAFVLLATLTNFFSQTCTASPIAQPEPEPEPQTADSQSINLGSNAQIPAEPFFYFPNSNQAENIRPRLNGQILVTLNTVPQLYQINPAKNQTGGIVHTFAGYTSLFGIVELQVDLFYLIASNYTGAPEYYGYQGSVSIFQVDLRGIYDPTQTPSAVKVAKIVDIPSAQLLDGLAVVNPGAGLLMSGDAQLGTLYLIDVNKKTATAVQQNALLAGNDDIPASSLNHIGINGIKVHGSSLYYTNTAKGFYATIPLNLATGQPISTPQILADYDTFTDDLSFDIAGNQFISEPLNGVLLRPANTNQNDNETRILTSLYGANSNAFGRTILDLCTLYSTFDGAPSGVARINVGKEGFCTGAT
ncbi:hypothetical protein MMC28_006583 [Mycoblastus sanguinarius]|nr:hypothetical protein [Mycoblastus sanguinarius]